MHCSYMITNFQSVKKYLTQFQKAALIFSAFCHDANHTGHTNIFEMNSLSKIALKFHDKSVLFQLFYHINEFVD